MKIRTKRRVSPGARIAAARDAHNVAQERLADALGIHRVVLSAVERGLVEPSLAWTQKAVRACVDLAEVGFATA